MDDYEMRWRAWSRSLGPFWMSKKRHRCHLLPLRCYHPTKNNL